MRTITLKTNHTDLNAFRAYGIYERRQTIEQFFETYGDTISYEEAYRRNSCSTIIGVNEIEEIAFVGESKNIL